MATIACLARSPYSATESKEAQRGLIHPRLVSAFCKGEILMRLLFDKIFGGGYEAQVLEKKSQRRLFVMLLFYLFFLGIIVDGTPARSPTFGSLLSWQSPCFGMRGAFTTS